jgi:hypothetical protein
MLPDFERAERIGEFWGHPETRTFGELLIDLEEDKAARAVVSGYLGRWSGSSVSRPHRSEPRLGLPRGHGVARKWRKEKPRW